jgi:hypothetical protein
MSIRKKKTTHTRHWTRGGALLAVLPKVLVDVRNG